ncbi:MAG: hypothetical protein QM754_12530 [Tepidisphaeraceae bacterium]
MVRSEDITSVAEHRDLAMVELSLVDIHAGRTQPASQAILDIAAEFGLTFEHMGATVCTQTVEGSTRHDC